MRTRLVVLLAGLSFFIAERKGYCDEPVVKDIPPGEDVIVGVKQNEKAPFTGQLFEPATALRWGNWLQQYKLRLEIDVQTEKKVCEAEKTLAQRKADIEAEKTRVISEDLRKQLVVKTSRVIELEKAADNPPFYKTVWFGMGLGVLVTGALFGLGVWAASGN